MASPFLGNLQLLQLQRVVLCDFLYPRFHFSLECSFGLGHVKLAEPQLMLECLDLSEVFSRQSFSFGLPQVPTFLEFLDFLWSTLAFQVPKSVEFRGKLLLRVTETSHFLLEGVASAGLVTACGAVVTRTGGLESFESLDEFFDLLVFLF